jgi:PHD/YefM family antitoxin component YafN of YafNO toxin-antitoxin module
MESSVKPKNREFIFRNGKPTAIILNIKEYQKLLERLEDAEDLKILKKMRKKPLKFHRRSELWKALDL